MRRITRVLCRVAVATALSLVPNAIINEAESVAYTPRASFTATFWGVPRQWAPPPGWTALEIADSCVNEVVALGASVLVYRQANRRLKVRWPESDVNWREFRRTHQRHLH